MSGTRARRRTAPAPEQIERLPEWAQQVIKNLQRRCAELESVVQGDHSGRPESPVQVIDSVHGREFGLNWKFEHLRVQIGEERVGTRPRHSIDIQRMDDGRLRLMASSVLVIQAHASNVVYLDLAARLEQREDVHDRDLGQRLLTEALAKGLDWQDTLNLIDDCDPVAVKATRNRYRIKGRLRP